METFLNCNEKIYQSRVFPLFSLRRIMETLYFNVGVYYFCINQIVTSFKNVSNNFMYFTSAGTLTNNNEKNLDLLQEVKMLRSEVVQFLSSTIICLLTLICIYIIAVCKVEGAHTSIGETPIRIAILMQHLTKKRLI
jgi:hypothetical protein